MRAILMGMAAASLMLGGRSVAAQSVIPAERPIRSWTQEMLDKAKYSLYEKVDCRTALTQINASYDRAARSRKPMDPEIALVKARAHDCLAQVPAAIAAYALYDQLTGADPMNDDALASSCSELAPAANLPADSTGRALLRQNLVAEEAGLRRVLRRADLESVRSDFNDQFDAQRRTQAMGAGPDGTKLTQMQYQALWPSYVQSWANLPSQTSNGFRTNNRQRYLAASSQFSAHLAEIEAKLICLDTTP